MDVKKYFDYSPDLELTVAQIGINKWDWISISSNDSIEARKLMLQNRFDILPLDSNYSVDKYFKTVKWGDFNEIELKEIKPEDKIYYRLSFLDLLRKMLNDKKGLYFLEDSNDILGLITLNNLNCLAVYNYLYQITASLERILTEYLEKVLSEEIVLNILQETSDKQANKIASTYAEIKSKNIDNSIFHHIYFPTIGTILKKASKIIEKDKPKLLLYRKKFSTEQLYGKIRNTVSHPVKPLFINMSSISEVNELILDYIEIKQVLTN